MTYYNRFKYYWDLRYLINFIDKPDPAMKKFWKSMNQEDKDTAINPNIFNSINSILINNLEVTKAEKKAIEDQLSQLNEENQENLNVKDTETGNEDEEKNNSDVQEKIRMNQILSKNEREKINQIKVDLSNINSNYNFGKFAHISTNIYLE